MAKLQDQRQFKWLSPSALLGHLLETHRIEGWDTFVGEIARISEGESINREALARTTQTSRDVELYNSDQAKLTDERTLLTRGLVRVFMEHGRKGSWLAVGRRAPDADEELLPARYWSFLSLDFGAGKANSEDHGLCFAGLRCVILQDLPKDWQLRAIAEIDALERQVKNPDVESDKGEESPAPATAGAKKVTAPKESELSNRPGPTPPTDQIEKLRRDPRSQVPKMYDTLKELILRKQIDPSMNQKAMWNKVIEELKIISGTRGYGYSVFNKAIGPNIKSLFINN